MSEQGKKGGRPSEAARHERELEKLRLILPEVGYVFYEFLGDFADFLAEQERKAAEKRLDNYQI